MEEYHDQKPGNMLPVQEGPDGEKLPLAEGAHFSLKGTTITKRHDQLIRYREKALREQAEREHWSDRQLHDEMSAAVDEVFLLLDREQALREQAKREHGNDVPIKTSDLFTDRTIRRTEDFLDTSMSLTPEDKLRLLDFLAETLRKDYANYESFVAIDISLQAKIEKIKNAEDEEERSEKRHTVKWVIWIAFLVLAAVLCLYFSLQ